jgi:hypothetical protein
MAEPAQELTTEYVQSRVVDWKSRLSALYSRIEDAARRASILRAERVRTPARSEELMERYGVPAPELEKLVVTGSKGTLEVIPVALWVIGANGRADLIITDRAGRTTASILADVSERGAARPHWQLYEMGNRRQGADFDDRLMDEIVARIR